MIEADLDKIRAFLHEIDRQIAELEGRTQTKLARIDNEIRKLTEDHYQLRRDYAAAVAPMKQQRQAILDQLARLNAASMPQQIIILDVGGPE